MKYREQNIKMDRENDYVGMSTPESVWNGDELKFELSVSRRLRSGDQLETKYQVRMSPEDAVCAYRRLRDGIRSAADSLRTRAADLEEEL